MNKLKLQTANLANEKFAKLVEMFPNVVTETITGYDVDGKAIVGRAIDADVLRQEINSHVVEGRDQRYQFTWPDKRKAILRANSPATVERHDGEGKLVEVPAALRPCREESVDFDTTQNLYIEGDNLAVLKLLRETYLNSVKVIYIDPPYNTGNDFVYKDDFASDKNEFLSLDKQFDEEGNRLVKNLDSNGRFHTDWLNMIYPRLRVARDLLSEDGIIFISIDEQENENLMKVCDEIFGKSLRMGTFIWKRRQMVDSRSKTGISEDHEYMLCYAKMNQQRIRGKRADMSKYSNPDNDPKGVWMSADMTGLATAAQRPNLHYDLMDPETKVVYKCPSTGWRYEKTRMAELIGNKEVLFPKNHEGRPRRKKYAKDLKSQFTGLSTILDTVYNTQATRELKFLFDGADFFDFPKPVELIKLFIEQATLEDDIVLDFFSGSATTAHAVMQLNADDLSAGRMGGGKRKFIMVQLPELTDKESEAYKAGYKNICEIGKERIRRAGKKIKADSPMTTKDLDVGFRVLKLDSSNMKDVYYESEKFVQAQSNFENFIDNIKDGRSSEDLLFQVMLDLDIQLSAKVESREFGKKTVFIVNDNQLCACFEAVDDATVTAIAKLKPYYAVFRDSSFKNDATLANFEQIFATYSPTTIRKVL
jgi:adenine-specific DNA-methyltransferase